MQDKRLTVNPLSYKGIRRFPQDVSEHGRRWDKKLQCFVSSPSFCKLGGIIGYESFKDGSLNYDRPIKKPCHACETAMRASEPQVQVQRKRNGIKGFRYTLAFFKP